MTVPIRAAALVTAMVFGGCSSYESRAARIAGCYSIETGEFAPPGPMQAAQRLPRMVRLDTSKKEFLLASKLDHRTIADIVGGGDFFFSRDGAWNLESDTLSLIWSSAFTGAEIRVATRGSRMQGYIQFFSDQVGDQMPRATVTLTLQSCG